MTTHKCEHCSRSFTPTHIDDFECGCHLVIEVWPFDRFSVEESEDGSFNKPEEADDD